MAGSVGSGVARALLREPRWRRWFIAATFARLVSTMSVMSLVFSGRWATSSFATGAYLAAAYGLGAAVGAPFRGQALDRQRMPDGIIRALVQQALLLGVLAAAMFARAPLPVLLGLTAVLGVLPSGVPGAWRAMLGRVVPPERLEAAFTLDAVLIEICWIAGPALASAVAAVAPPVLNLGLMAASALLSAFLARALPVREAPADAPPVRWPDAWRDPGMGEALVLAVVLGLSWGAVEAGMPARLVEVGQPAELWGGLVSWLSATSMLGGLLYAQFAPSAGTSASARRRVRVFLALWGVLLLPLLGTESRAGLALWLGLAGLVLAPLSGVVTYLLQRALSEGKQVQGFSLYYAAFGLGMAAGSGLAGLLIARDLIRGVLLVSAVVPLLAVVASLLVRAPEPAPGTPEGPRGD